MSIARYASILTELEQLASRSGVLDAHTHLGADEDGRSLQPGALLAALGEVGPTARTGGFPFHDPEAIPPIACPPSGSCSHPTLPTGGPPAPCFWRCVQPPTLG